MTNEGPPIPFQESQLTDDDVQALTERVHSTDFLEGTESLRGHGTNRWVVTFAARPVPTTSAAMEATISVIGEAHEDRDLRPDHYDTEGLARTGIYETSEFSPEAIDAILQKERDRAKVAGAAVSNTVGIIDLSEERIIGLGAADTFNRKMITTELNSAT